MTKPIESSNSKNLAKKLLQIMAKIKPIGKDGWNDYHKYSYVREATILEEIRILMAEAGVIALPNQVARIREDNTTVLEVEFTLFDVESGETMTLTTFGEGSDSQDKGVYKAATGANKYFLMKTFLIPTVDDPEGSEAKAKARRGRSADKPTGGQGSREKNVGDLVRIKAGRPGGCAVCGKEHVAAGDMIVKRPSDGRWCAEACYKAKPDTINPETGEVTPSASAGWTDDGKSSIPKGKYNRRAWQKQIGRMHKYDVCVKILAGETKLFGPLNQPAEFPNANTETMEARASMLAVDTLDDAPVAELREYLTVLLDRAKKAKEESAK